MDAKTWANLRKRQSDGKGGVKVVFNNMQLTKPPSNLKDLMDKMRKKKEKINKIEIEVINTSSTHE